MKLQNRLKAYKKRAEHAREVLKHLPSWYRLWKPNKTLSADCLLAVILPKPGEYQINVDSNVGYNRQVKLEVRENGQRVFYARGM